MKILTCFCALLLMTYNSQFPWSPKLQSKIKKTVELSYQSNSHQLQKLEFDEAAEEKTKSQLKNTLFAVSLAEEKVGHVYVNQAPSMKNVFDYIVLFDQDWKIINTKVLIYRETHGKQIGTKRWLSQFFGMRPEDRPVLGSNIDGITGATISVNGMTTAVHDLLVSIDYLIKEGAIE